MASIRPMDPCDLLAFADCNLDPLTETYNITFYLEYLAKWPHSCHVICGRSGNIEGYILGKVEASPSYNRPTKEPYDPSTNKNLNYLPWHAHITALTVAPAARRLGHAKKLTEIFEQEGDARNAWFVDLYVRTENQTALKLYESMGYSVYRRVVDYYSDGEDAFDMRKPLSRDTKRQTVRENGKKFHVDPAMVCPMDPLWASGEDVEMTELEFMSQKTLVACDVDLLCTWVGQSASMLKAHLISGAHSLTSCIARKLVVLRSEAVQDRMDDVQSTLDGLVVRRNEILRCMEEHTTPRADCEDCSTLMEAREIKAHMGIQSALTLPSEIGIKLDSSGDLPLSWKNLEHRDKLIRIQSAIKGCHSHQERISKLLETYKSTNRKEPCDSPNRKNDMARPQDGKENAVPSQAVPKAVQSMELNDNEEDLIDLRGTSGVLSTHACGPILAESTNQFRPTRAALHAFGETEPKNCPGRRISPGQKTSHHTAANINMDAACICAYCELRRGVAILRAHDMLPDWLPKIPYESKRVFVEGDDLHDLDEKHILQKMESMESPIPNVQGSPRPKSSDSWQKRRRLLSMFLTVNPETLHGMWEPPMMPVKAWTGLPSDTYLGRLPDWRRL